MPPEQPRNVELELAAAREEIEALRSSLRFTIGDVIVSAVAAGNGKVTRVLPALFHVFNTGRRALTLARLRSEIFTGLPEGGLPPPPNDVTPSEMKALMKLARHRRANGKADAAEKPWVRSARAAIEELWLASERGVVAPKAKVTAKLKPGPQRIAYVSQHDPRTSTAGYARRTREIVNRLRDRGHHVLVVCPESAGHKGFVAGGTADGIAYSIAPAGSEVIPLGAYIERFAEFIRREAAGFDATLIHAGSNYLNGLAALTTARELSLPLVYELRGLWEETRLTKDPAFAGKLGYRVQARLETDLSREADALIIGSEGIMTELQRRGLERPHTLTLSGAPELPNRDVTATEAIRRRYGLSSEKVAGFVGSITGYEGLDTLVAAMARLQPKELNLKCLIVGDGHYRAELQRLVARRGLEDRFIFTGRLDFASAIEALSAVDFCVYARNRHRVTDIVEPLKPLEALSCGVPVIVSDVVPLAELARTCPGVRLVPADSPADLAEAIGDLARLPAPALVDLGAQSRAWIHANRTWDRTVDAIEESYRSL